MTDNTTHYRLKDGVFSVFGARCGALLDTTTGRVYSVNDVAVAELKSTDTTSDYWQMLATRGLAEVCTDHAVSSPLAPLPQTGQPQIDFIWFEIASQDCNERCIHCYADSMPRAHRPTEITLQDTQEIRLSYAEWCELISEGYNLGCRSCQFIGGEPLLYRDGQYRVLDLAEHAQHVGYEFIEIFTNGTLITENMIGRIQHLGLSIAISLYSQDADVHDQITCTPGSHARTMAALDLLQQANIPTRVAIIGMHTNEHTLLETITFLEEKGFGAVRVDPLRPTGRGDNKDLLPSKETLVRHGVRVAPDFTADWSTVAHYTTQHSCLSGKICVTENGDVLPCIFSRDEKVGNVKEAGNLESVIETSLLQRIWNTTKDDVMVCRDCEYRYACFDCRPLAEGTAQGAAAYFEAPDPRCSYNPYTGEWGEGLWIVTDGVPVYNREYAEIIREIYPASVDGINQPSVSELEPALSHDASCDPCYPTCSPICSPGCSPKHYPNCDPNTTAKVPYGIMNAKIA